MTPAAARTTAKRAWQIRMVTGALAASAALLGAAAWHLTRADTAVQAMASGQYRLAGEFYAAAAAEGDPRAANSLANLLYLGLGVPRDLRRAAELYHRSAAEGHAPAHLNLGHLYSQGLGVAPDRLRAFAWYRMADVHGNPLAEYYLRQISLEYTLSPLQMAWVKQHWNKLDSLLAEEL